MSDYVNEALLGASPYKKQADESKALVSKWDKTGLLDGLNEDFKKSGMATMLENQARQLIQENSATGGGAGSGTAGTAYSFTTPDQVGATDLPKPIADVADTTVTSTLTVAQNLRIIDVNVYLGLSHTWPGDLTVTLTSPAGITIDLLVNACGGTDDIDVVFDDEGSELECSVNPPSVSGVIRPQSGALSIFNEQSSQGDWTLTVLDGYDLDGGSIDYLALEITSDGEWSNTAPIAFPQSATTSTQFIALKLEGLDPERLPLTYELRNMGIPVVNFTPSKGNDKHTRVNSVAPLFESGTIWAPTHKGFAQEVIEECAAFPYGDHDDLVDSMTQAVMRFRQGGLIPHPEDYKDEKIIRGKQVYY